MTPSTASLSMRSPDSSAPLRQFIPGFEILEELGRGGMGVVYKARQSTLNRIVALKTILAGTQVQESDQLRFLAEAEAVAAVRHSNVVQVYEFGHAEGQAYFAMEFLEGGSLASLLVEHRKLSAVFVAGIVQAIARGVQAAHDVGVVHRDLKPANILFGTDEPDRMNSSEPARARPIRATPKVTDFGLAKRGGGHDLTLTGVVMGTPAYMAPEQAQGQGKFVGPAADIYALGVVLFECLAGRPPFYGDDPTVVLTRVVLDDPPPLQRFTADVPRDLELICLKCLEKTPAARYPTAAALADDLARFVQGEPVSVRPAGKLEKAAKWVRRYPTRAALYGVTLLASALIGLTAGVVEMWRTAEFNRRQTSVALTYAEQAKLRAEQLQGNAESEQARADTEKWKAEQATLDAEEAREAVTQKQIEVEHARAHEADMRAALAIARAQREIEWDNTTQARKLLEECPVSLRGWEWYFARNACDRKGSESIRLEKRPGIGSCNAIVITDDGSRIVLGGSHYPVSAFDTHTGQSVWHTTPTDEAVLDLRITSKGECVRGFLEDGTIYEWKLKTGDELKVTAGKHLHQPVRIAANGTRHITWNEFTGAVTVFDPTIAHDVQSTGAHPGLRVLPALSSNGACVITAGLDRTVRLWDAETGQQLQVFSGHSGVITAIAFHPDGRRIATAGAEGWLKIWDSTSGRDVLTFRLSTKRVCAVGWSADGTKLIAIDAGGTAFIRDAGPLTQGR